MLRAMCRAGAAALLVGVALGGCGGVGAGDVARSLAAAGVPRALADCVATTLAADGADLAAVARDPAGRPEVVETLAACVVATGEAGDTTGAGS